MENVDSWSKIWKKSILGQIMEKCILGQSYQKNQFLIKIIEKIDSGAKLCGKLDSASNLWRKSILGQNDAKKRFLVKLSIKIVSG